MFATATKEKGTNLRAATCQLLIGSKFAIVVANNDCKAISLAVIKNRIGANFEMDVDPITPYICQAIVGCDKGRGTSRVTRSLTGRAATPTCDVLQLAWHSACDNKLKFLVSGDCIKTCTKNNRVAAAVVAAAASVYFHPLFS
ncbi:unnamed protein product [Mesocestoides corti]|uniref:Uncharacterized protein n=1 Tax=Mesocestoides corti TaxID=53468 RepID=A0A0R3UQ55_MESCO|nr:unnamed protein product [Mesocestoides corti]